VGKLMQRVSSSAMIEGIMKVRVREVYLKQVVDVKER